MKPVLALAAAWVLSACTTANTQTAAAGVAASDAAATAGRACFRLQDIRNHRIADPRTLYLDVAGREVYRLDMTGACMAAAMRDDPIITSTPGGSGIVCRPIELDLKVRTTGFTNPCIIGNITRLTPQEAAALPADIRP